MLLRQPREMTQTQVLLSPELEVQATGPFEKQLETRAWSVCRVARVAGRTLDRLQPPHSGTQVEEPGPMEPRPAASRRHLRQVCWAAFFSESAGQGGRPTARIPRTPGAPARLVGSPRPAGRRGRRGSLVRHCRRVARSLEHRAPARPSSLRVPAGAPGPHLVEAVLAVRFRFHLHFHQHRVWPRHIAQHGWGRRRLLPGVRGAVASPPFYPSPEPSEGGFRGAATLRTSAQRSAAVAPTPPPRHPAPARTPAGSPRLGSSAALEQPNCCRRDRDFANIVTRLLRLGHPPITAVSPLLRGFASQ